MSTRTLRIVHRVSTGIVCAVGVFSAINFSLAHPIGPAAENFGPGGAFAHLGLPTWFKVELTAAKILGVLALLIPGVPAKVKEFAYFGFGLTFVSAAIAHAGSGDGIAFRLDPLIFFGVLLVAYGSFLRLQRPGENPATDAGAPSGANLELVR
jgi:hypothetical protein